MNYKIVSQKLPFLPDRLMGGGNVIMSVETTIEVEGQTFVGFGCRFIDNLASSEDFDKELTEVKRLSIDNALEHANAYFDLSINTKSLFQTIAGLKSKELYENAIKDLTPEEIETKKASLSKPAIVRQQREAEDLMRAFGFCPFDLAEEGFTTLEAQAIITALKSAIK